VSLAALLGQQSVSVADSATGRQDSHVSHG
jgi:hypothetical protein